MYFMRSYTQRPQKNPVAIRDRRGLTRSYVEYIVGIRKVSNGGARTLYSSRL